VSDHDDSQRSVARNHSDQSPVLARRAKPSKLFLGSKFTSLAIVLFIEGGDHEANSGCGVIDAFRQYGRAEAPPVHRNHDSGFPSRASSTGQRDVSVWSYSHTV